MNRLWNSFGYALKGIRIAFMEQLNLKIHALAAILVVAAGFYFNITHVEWLGVTLAIGIVVITELINTALEYVVDFVSPAYKPLAGKIKDIAAGAVLVAAIEACTVGVVVFSKYFYNG